MSLARPATLLRPLSSDSRTNVGIDIISSEAVVNRGLQVVAVQGHKTVVELLLENGAGIDVEDRDGPTVLHYMANSKQKVIA